MDAACVRQARQSQIARIHEVIKVQAGTQYIDGFWRILRAYIRSWRMSEISLLRLVVRVAQLQYWSRGKDLYLEGARVIQCRLA